MLRRIFSLILMIFLLTGCSSKSSMEEITFSSWGSVSEVKIIKQIISEFESDNPNIKIKFLHFPQNYFPKLHLLFASKTEPDVIFINNLNLPVYADFLEDLTPYLDNKEFYIQAIEGLSYQNKILAMPRDVSNLVLYVNLDILKTMPDLETLEDLLNLTLSLKNSKVFSISYEDDVYWAIPYISYFGGEITDENLTSETLKGIFFYKDLLEKYRVAPSKSEVGSSTLAQMFIDEKLAIYLSGRWMYPKISEMANFNWTTVPFPNGKNPQPCDSSGWAISKNSKHKESSLKFVKYLSDEKSSEYFSKTGLIIPARIKVSQRLSKENEQAFLETLNYSKKTYIDKNYKKTVDKINTKYLK